MIPLVIDTDVFVAALLSRNDSSVAREVIRRCLKGYYQPLFGVALFSEYEALLSRDKLFAECQLSYKEREAIFAALLKQARWIEVYFAWRPNLQDEGDNHLIELAVACGAQAIITRNTRDLKMQSYFSRHKSFNPETMLGGIQMSTMTIRLPDDKHLRLKQLAKSRHLSINKLVEELATSILSAHDAEVRFHALALRGNPKKALVLLDKLDVSRK